MRTDLAVDPAVIAISDALGVPETHTVGLLHKVWSWADQHAHNGHAPSVTSLWLDRYVGVTGLARAMCDVGWLDDSHGLRFPDFDRHNGGGAKTRALNAERKKRERQRGEDITPPSRTQRDNSVTRVEKNRVVKTPPKPPLIAGDFERVWKAYPKRVSKGQAEKTWTKLAPDAALVERILAAIEQAKASPAWQKDGGQFIPHLSSWLNAKGWEDELNPVAGDMGQWWKSDDGVVAKGKELGVPRGKENFIVYKAKVFLGAGEGPWHDPRDATLQRFMAALREGATA